MTNELIQKLAKSENLDINGDSDYFVTELNEWLKSLCGIFKEAELCGDMITNERR